MARLRGHLLSILIIWEFVHADPDYMRNLGEEEQNERLHELFDHIDANGNELLDPTELTQEWFEDRLMIHTIRT